MKVVKICIASFKKIHALKFLLTHGIPSLPTTLGKNACV